jgi:hypothetical protein
MRDNLFLPFGATTRIVLPVTQALGTQWELVQTPLIYFKEPIDSLHGEDDPRWRFSPTRDKIPLDPQYR